MGSAMDQGSVLALPKGSDRSSVLAAGSDRGSGLDRGSVAELRLLAALSGSERSVSPGSGLAMAPEAMAMVRPAGVAPKAAAAALAEEPTGSCAGGHARSRGP